MEGLITLKNKVLKNGVHFITDDYKTRNGSRNHSGIDLVSYNGSYTTLDFIVAIDEGEVIRAGYDNLNGNHVAIKHKNGYTSWYLHMADGTIKVGVGDKVMKEQVIGYMGNTGDSRGAHLHFQINNTNNENVDPLPYLKGEKTLNEVEPTTESIEYRVHLRNGSWLPWVNKVDDTDDGYAGIFGKEIDGIQIKNRIYQAHYLNGKWLSEISKVDDTDMGYAGIYGKSIDGLKVHNATYRVHLKNGGWLPWVNKVDNTDDGYAGIYSKVIDGVQVKEL